MSSKVSYKLNNINSKFGKILFSGVLKVSRTIINATNDMIATIKYEIILFKIFDFLRGFSLLFCLNSTLSSMQFLLLFFFHQQHVR
jgi:hypothetical protein